MINPTEHMAAMQERKRQLLRSARMHQLFQQAEQDRPTFGVRLMALLGDLMISGGTKLKQRSSPRYTVETQNL